MNILHRFKQSRKQLGSTADVILLTTTDEIAAQVFHRLWETMDTYESRFSRFNPDSELSYINRHAGETVTISQEFTEMLHSCAHYYHLTGGVFNPLLLPALQKAGYKGSWPAVTTYDTSLDYSDRVVATFDEVQIGSNTVCLPHNTALDLGGIGKGYALDIAASVIEREGIENYCVSFGGDIICNGNDINEKPWQIGVSYVHDHDKPIAFFRNIDSQKLAIASSTVVRRKGATWNHLIDSKTGEPTKSPVLMATVVTSSGVAADIGAKFFLLAPDASLKNASSSDEALSILFQYESDTKLVQNIDYIQLK